MENSDKAPSTPLNISSMQLPKVNLSEDKNMTTSPVRSQNPPMFNFHHLPTPQSPSTFGSIGPVPQTPESPLSHGAHYLPSRRTLPIARSLEDTTPRPASRLTQMATPESSPFRHFTGPQPPPDFLSALHKTPTASSSSVKLEFSLPLGRPQTPPLSSPVQQQSTLSSPFADKLPKPARRSPMDVDNAFVARLQHSSPTVPSSSTISSVVAQIPDAGGEIDRIRQDKISAYQEVESRRPDYLTRGKRPFSEIDPSTINEDPIGIMDSPNKGRRITLFQETSEESFEESLMAGGYGRYRTAEWVRQPQPLALTGGPTGSSNIVSMLEEAKEEQPPPPPTEKELKKRRRLTAFRTDNGLAPAKLYPVELEGKGRVLLDIPNEAISMDSSLAKKPHRTRRKKGEAPLPKELKRPTPVPSTDVIEQPDWPDGEFPWRVRTTERTAYAKAEEEERMKWIEKFLDRDTDDEDDGDNSGSPTAVEQADEEVLSSSKWGIIYDDDAPVPYRRGRGKMVPLHANPAQPAEPLRRRRNAFFPSDPADAKAALLSKKSVRTLSYRQQRKRQARHETVCICRGKDDGRELVQCDSCRMWFHLQCLGIHNIRELGREEDAWFCQDCSPDAKTYDSDSDSDDLHFQREPVFVDNDVTHFQLDAEQEEIPYEPFFHGGSLFPESPPPRPHEPRTPTRYDDMISSSPPVLYSSRQSPVTPRRQYDGYDDSQFDPASTPSRGLKIPGTFTTPKWVNGKPVVTSAHFQFQTPNQVVDVPKRGSKSFGGPGFLTSMLDDPSFRSPYPAAPRSTQHEDSPARRTSDDQMRRTLDSNAIGARYISSYEGYTLQESPVVRSKGKERDLADIDDYSRLGHDVQ